MTLPITDRYTRRIAARHVVHVGGHPVYRDLTTVRVPCIGFEKSYLTPSQAEQALQGFIHGPAIEKKFLKHLSTQCLLEVVGQFLADKPAYYSREIARRGLKSNPAQLRPSIAQIRRGSREEAKEHRLGPKLSRKIAMDHLREHPRYYTYLGMMEKAMKSGKRVCLNPGETAPALPESPKGPEVLSNPYKTEHAARIRDPRAFIPSTYRTKWLNRHVRIIIGKLRSAGKRGSMVVQAYRFKVDAFTPSKAKAWLKKYRVSRYKFEASRA